MGEFVDVKLLKADKLRTGNLFRFPPTRSEVYAFASPAMAEAKGMGEYNAVNVENPSDKLCVRPFQEVLVVEPRALAEAREARTRRPGSPAAGLVHGLFFAAILWWLIYEFFIK
jgi:hypothetical protein